MLILYAHPFSSYSWKVLIALWENHIEFDYRSVEDAANAQAWQQAWPIKRMPLLVDGAEVVPEATIIIEYVQLHYPGQVKMIPAAPDAALQTRKLDRISDNYLMTPVQTIVNGRMRAAPEGNPAGVLQAHALLDTAYLWWDAHMTGREWAANEFGLADCATAPALFYADWVHPISEALPSLRDYRRRLLLRPSVARAVEEARPFRSMFPSGAPPRD